MIWGEQGLGDEILFAQFIPEFIMIHKPAKVIFDCHPRLIHIWERYFGKLNVKLYPTRKTKSPWVSQEDPIHYKMAIASVPQYCESKNNALAGQQYFIPNQEKVKEMRGADG